MTNDIRYFKPRKDLEYSSLLLPQKIVKDKQYRYCSDCGFFPHWKENDGVSLDLLSKNFIEVQTEAEACGFPWK